MSRICGVSADICKLLRPRLVEGEIWECKLDQVVMDTYSLAKEFGLYSVDNLTF